MPLGRNYYTLLEVSEILQVHRNTVLDMSRRGQIPFFQIRHRSEKRITREDLVAYFNRQKIPLRFLEDWDAAHVRVRVLIVEDEKNYAARLAALLGEDGRLEVEVAHNGTEGALKLGSFRPQILLLDWKLSGMLAEEFLKRTKTAIEEFGTRVVLMSVHSRKDIAPGGEVEEKFRALGVEQFVAKYEGTDTIRGVVYSISGLPDRRAAARTAEETK